MGTSLSLAYRFVLGVAVFVLNAPRRRGILAEGPEGASHLPLRLEAIGRRWNGDKFLSIEITRGGGAAEGET